MKREILTSTNDDTDRLLEHFKRASVENQRFMVHTHKIYPFNEVVKYETDEKLCYFTQTIRPRFGTVGFIDKSPVEGFTYNKEKKKLSIWFNMNINKVSSHLKVHMLKDLKVDWFNMATGSMFWDLCSSLFTRYTLERIIKGKITDMNSLILSYCKNHIKIKELDSNLLQEYLISRTSTNINSLNIYSIPRLKSMLDICNDPNNFIKGLMKLDAHVVTNVSRYDIEQIISYCKITGKKINWTSSSAIFSDSIAKMRIDIGKLEDEYRIFKEFYLYNSPNKPEGVIIKGDNLPF